jgi:hypothetical protein
MRTVFLAAAFGALLTGSPAALAQSADQIKGESCRQLYRSCMRICIRHFGEPTYRGCQSDCTNGHRACRSTLTWKSRNATITVTRLK